jgi:uncharacterized protein
MEFEKRYADLEALEVKPTDDNQLEGYAIVFNQETKIYDEFFEIIDPMAVSSNFGDVRFLWNHNSDIVLGRTAANTLSLEKNDFGLRFSSILPAWANGYHETIQRGDVSGMSFGFRVTQDTWSIRNNSEYVRRILGLEILEISTSTFPAYPTTSVQVRSLPIYNDIDNRFKRNMRTLKIYELTTRGN